MKLVPFSTNIHTTDTHFFVSDEDYARVSKRKWFADYNGKSHYRIVSAATKAERKAGLATKIKLHRFIFNLTPKDKVVVDHINSWLDNTRNGLRIATTAENSRYVSKRLDKKSGLPKGVHSRGKKFYATITFQGEAKYLGTYSTSELAHEAYKKAAKDLFGDFAKFE